MCWSPKEHVALFHNVMWTIPSATHLPRHLLMCAWDCCGAAYPLRHMASGLPDQGWQLLLPTWGHVFISPWFLLSPIMIIMHSQIRCTKLWPVVWRRPCASSGEYTVCCNLCRVSFSAAIGSMVPSGNTYVEMSPVTARVANTRTIIIHSIYISQ